MGRSFCTIVSVLERMHACPVKRSSGVLLGASFARFLVARFLVARHALHAIYFIVPSFLASFESDLCLVFFAALEDGPTQLWGWVVLCNPGNCPHAACAILRSMATGGQWYHMDPHTSPHPMPFPTMEPTLSIETN
mmetsp:Transcript_97998/g.204424  ORF Transcript_97998/g.204424 Transcript_97998/m.204424 type:complete len:136 (-) Transcript_97998:26-433(-)